MVAPYVLEIKPHTLCRICGSEKLIPFLDLGEQPLANAFLAEADLSRPEPRYPLRALFCENCGLSQLGETVSPEVLFRQYVYFSSGMPSEKHFRAYAEEVRSRFINDSGDLVVEIGSNDGHLLRPLRDFGSRVLGVDPARNIAAAANQQGVETIVDFFSEKLARGIRAQYGAARVILANNVVAHIDDHHDLIRGVRELLHPQGIFIFEAPYLLDMFENLAFDSIYHEHLSYLSVRPLARLLGEHGLEIFEVKMTPAQGNYSLRVYVCKKGARPAQSSVAEFLAMEKGSGFGDLSVYRDLASRIANLKEDTVETVSSLKKRGKRIAAYGAPARGNTLLNYFGIGRDALEYATEELPSKIGLYTPGMKVPVVDVREARKNPPDYYLLLAWPYQNVILEKEKAFREKGGKFIVPIGDTRII